MNREVIDGCSTSMLSRKIVDSPKRRFLPRHSTPDFASLQGRRAASPPLAEEISRTPPSPVVFSRDFKEEEGLGAWLEASSQQAAVGD